MENLLFGYGFQRRHGSNHDVFTHPNLTGEQFILPRHGSVKKAYIAKQLDLLTNWANSKILWRHRASYGERGFE